MFDNDAILFDDVIAVIAFAIVLGSLIQLWAYAVKNFKPKRQIIIDNLVIRQIIVVTLSLVAFAGSVSLAWFIGNWWDTRDLDSFSLLIGGGLFLLSLVAVFVENFRKSLLSLGS